MYNNNNNNCCVKCACILQYKSNRNDDYFNDAIKSIKIMAMKGRLLWHVYTTFETVCVCKVQLAFFPFQR